MLCGGANYSKHLRQMAYAHLKREGDPRPEEELRAAADEISARRAREDPFVFAGLPSALCGADDDVILWGPGHEHDWELELAVVHRPRRPAHPGVRRAGARRRLHDLQRRQHPRRHAPARASR